jgi:hypothetical protein
MSFGFTNDGGMQPWGVGGSNSVTTSPSLEPEQVHSKDASIGVKVVYTPPDGISVVEYVSFPQACLRSLTVLSTQHSSRPRSQRRRLQNMDRPCDRTTQERSLLAARSPTRRGSERTYLNLWLRQRSREGF